jgi:hypothetical protein
MGDQGARRRPLHVGRHPPQGEAGLHVIRQELAHEAGEEGHYIEVRDEEGKVTDGERTGLHRTRHQEQDHSRAQAGGVARHLVEEDRDQAVSQDVAPPLPVELVELGHHVRLGPGDLDRLDATEDLADQPGDAVGRFSARPTGLLQPTVRRSYQQDRGH